MAYVREYAEGSTLIRVPASIRDRLVKLRRKEKYSWGGEGPPESLGKVIDRLVEGAEKPVPKPVPKKKTAAAKVVNKRRRGPGRRRR